MGSVRRRRGASLLVAAVAVTSCASRATDTPGLETGSTASSPFTVGAVPAGYELVTAGTGTREGDWGDDSVGTVEPYTVLSPDGRADHPDVVLVSTTGFEGYQGGLGQASRGYMAEPEDLTIDGAEAIFAPAANEASGIRWADLVVVRGDDLAVRVTSPSASKAELIALAARVATSRDRTQAPTVPDPPAGLRVLGSVDVDGVLAADASVAPHTDQVPGPTSAHAAGWVRSGSDEVDHLAVLTVPGASLDLAVASVRAPAYALSSTAHTRTVGGRRGLVVDEVWEGFSQTTRSVLVESDWGDVVVVRATGSSVPTEDELVAIAASVRPTDDATWERFVVEATGGPGLHADRGRHELARGRIGDLEWLLQDGPPDRGVMWASQEPDPDRLRGVDRCLKLSNRTRACADTASGGAAPGDWWSITGSEPPAEHGLSFVVVSTTVEAAAVRVTTSTGAATVPLELVPAEGLWAAVVFVADPGFPTCDSAGRTPSPNRMRMEALDAAGGVLRCLGDVP
ncbi:MAG: hypothetical protein ACT4OV_07745 [Microthrixaceae bacterium]